MASTLRKHFDFSNFNQLFQKVRAHHRFLDIVFNILKLRNVKCLRSGQLEALIKCEKNDCVVTLPTGYGKTLIFQILPWLGSSEYCVSKAVIIASPLDSLILEQVERLENSVCISAKVAKALAMHFGHGGQGQGGASGDVDDVGADVEEDEEDIGDEDQLVVDKLLRGDCRYIVGHPEHLTSAGMQLWLRNSPP